MKTRSALSLVSAASVVSSPVSSRSSRRGVPVSSAGHAAEAVSRVTPDKPRDKRKTPDAVASSPIKVGRGKLNASKPKSSPSKSSKGPAPRTESFSACWAGNYASTSASPVEPHTLILGTHPSVASLSENRYYAHPLNAFWWIAGDCLGFRRGTGVSPSTGKVYELTSSLRGSDGEPLPILPYPEQLAAFVSSGFALWDVVASCERHGSLDQDIRGEKPNDVVSFCRAHPSVRRIILSNGGTTSILFVKHFASWLATGQLVADSHEMSQKALGKAIERLTGGDVVSRVGWTSDHSITVVSAISVSPAAARQTYKEKRDFWDEHVYIPGLALLDEQRVTSRYFN